MKTDAKYEFVNWTVNIFLVCSVLFIGLTTACSSKGPASALDCEPAYIDAKTIYDTAKYQEAIDAFSKFVAANPDSACADDARYFIARCYFKLKDFNTARDLFTTFIEEDSGSNFADSAHYYLARCEYELGNYNNAIGLFDEFILQYPNSSMFDNAQYFLGRCYYKLGGYSSALDKFALVIAVPETAYREAALLWSGRAEYELGKADVLQPSSSFNSAEGYFEMMFNDYSNGPYEDNGRYYYGLCAYRRLDYSVAVERFDYLRSNFPDSVYLDNAWYFLARSLYRSGDFSSSYAEFEGFLNAFDSGTYIDNANYFAGRCRYEMAQIASDPLADLQAAIDWFVKVKNDFSSSNWADNAYLYEIRSYIDMGDCTTASSLISQFEIDYASSGLLANARNYYRRNCP